MSTDNQAFFYIDGIPSKGLWVPLDDVTEWQQVQDKMQAAYPAADVDELLCSDIEGLPKYFYASNCDSFSMSEWAAFKEDQAAYPDLDEGVIAAYFENCGVSPLSEVEEAYQGEHDSDEAFADEYLESTGMLEEIPENLRCYFDTEAFARDMMYDYFANDGHYFRSL